MTYRLHTRLGFRVSRLARLMQARHEAALAEDGLTRLGAAVLGGVGDEGVSAPSELAAYVGITRPAMSRLLRGLETRGFISRAPGDGDGRQTCVLLTPKGEAALTRARAAGDALQAHFAAKLSPDALSALTAALALLAADEPDPTDF
ncbi:MarR family winged helix-turn-helix transcriptional regulator [Pararhodobacter zhoushanensis]|uniref:MarR family winged helix-turn-helix transcriptional regulator n=1 Tax=Pararhodobacter zhoushanensis TaxID=2479545 RepID=UPI000F8D7CB3|nr:MarR family winged helix-turn-helix transcriptional regulator [Pararhodobacter zhoushanensis]